MRIDLSHGNVVDDERSGVSALGTGHDLDQGGFPGAVLADQRVHFARAEVERHAIEGAKSSKGLADIASVEEQSGHELSERAGCYHSLEAEWPCVPLRTSERETAKVHEKL